MLHRFRGGLDYGVRLPPQQTPPVNIGGNRAAEQLKNRRPQIHGAHGDGAALVRHHLLFPSPCGGQGRPVNFSIIGGRS